MPPNVCDLHVDLVKRAAQYGIRVPEIELDDEVPGEFDGPTIKLNKNYEPTERAFYLAQSVGSIAEWSLYCDRTQQVFEELQEAKRQRLRGNNRLECAVDAYLAFEQRTWELAVWLLAEIGHGQFVEAVTNFGRADMEVMRLFHITGKAPVWREFFAVWNEQVQLSERLIAPFNARRIPPFDAIKTPNQEIVQEDKGDGLVVNAAGLPG